jgi:hypothetical protein
MKHTDSETQRDAQPSPTSPEGDDVRGYGAEGIFTGNLVPPLPSTPPPLPAAGAYITGWPDATPPVTDPATVAAWLAQKSGQRDP